MKTQQTELIQQQIVRGQHRYEESSKEYVAEGPYKHTRYPIIKYHARDGRTREVKNAAEEERLEPDWQDKRPTAQKRTTYQDKLRQENDRLRIENKKLRTATNTHDKTTLTSSPVSPQTGQSREQTTEKGPSNPSINPASTPSTAPTKSTNGA